MPRPIRGWDGEEFSIQDIKDQEDQQVFEDEVLMFRFRMIWIVAEEVRKMMGHDQPVAFGMEQPAEPNEMPEVVTSGRPTNGRSWLPTMALRRCHSSKGTLEEM